MDLHDLAVRIKAVNAANGFDPSTWDNLPSKLMFVVTELDEARSAVLGIGQDPLGEEVADTAIRLLDIIGSVFGDDWAERVPDRHPHTHCFEAIERILWRPLQYCCLAVEAWRRDQKLDVQISLELAIRAVVVISHQIGIDLEDEIERKLKRNSERGKLHGMVRSDG